MAIKRLHSHFAGDPSFVAMLVDEARLASRIHHPNVGATLDVVSRDGELFVVMEYIEGASLAELLRCAGKRQTPMPLPIAVAIGLAVLAGLHAAHEAKSDDGQKLHLVHRDVSPQNVLVGIDGVPRLIDFGVAKAAGRLQSTQEGQLKGKLAYMAPEQLERGEIDRRADVYSAAVVLWEMLAGRQLFRAPGEGQMVTLVLRGATDPPSRHAPNIPAELDAVIMRALSNDPRHRYEDARQMAVALRGALTPAGTTEIGEWVRETARDAIEGRAARIAGASAESVGELWSSFSLVPTKAAPTRSRNWSAAAALGLLVAVAASAILYAMRPAHSPTTVDVTASAPAAPAPGPSDTAESTSPADSAATTAGSAAAPAVRAVKPRTRPLRANCNPPYTIDEEGVHQFKRECLVTK